MPSRAVIDDFLKQKRLALVGVSREPRAFQNVIFRTLRQRGYEVVPVNPHSREIEGLPCYSSVCDLPKPVDGVLVMVPAAKAAGVVADCQAAGVRRVWLHQGAGAGAVSAEAVALARQADMALIDGACPMMFLGGWFHQIHRFFARIDP